MSGVIFFFHVDMMNIAMFSRSQFKKEEGRRTCGSKPRPVCLISASLNKGQSSSFGPDVSNIQGNPQMDSGSVEGAAGNCRQDIVQNRVQNPETYSQVWNGDNQSRRSCGKLQHCVHDHVTHDGRSCEKQQHCAHDYVMHESSCGKLQQDSAGRGKLQAGDCPRQHA